MAHIGKWLDAANGSDGNDGNTETTAYQTLNKAIAPGGTAPATTIFVKPGVYWLTSQPTINSSAALRVVGTGPVIIKQPNAYNVTVSSFPINWFNINFANTGTLLVPGNVSMYLNNCTAQSAQLSVANVGISVTNYAVNVTTPTNVLLSSPVSATTQNLFYGSGAVTGTSLTRSFRCMAGSGTYVGGAFLNPSGAFPALAGAYPMFPAKTASIDPMRIYPPNAYTGTVRSTTGSGCWAASPMQQHLRSEDADDTTYATRISEFTATSVSNTRYNLDYTTPIVAEGVFIVNGGTSVTKGAKNFILQGSNSATAFADTTYATDTNWTDIGSGTFNQRATAAVGNRSAQMVPITNSTAYRYYSVKLVDNWGGATNITVTKLLIAAKNTFSQCDMDNYIIAGSATFHFPASSTGWANDSTYTSGSATVSDYGITLGSGTSARAVGPVCQYNSQVTIRNIAMSGSEAAAPSQTIIDYRISDTPFMPSSTSPTWTTYARNSDITAVGTYVQYRFTFYAG